MATPKESKEAEDQARAQESMQEEQEGSLAVTKLLEEERRQEIAQRERIGKITMAIEQVLIDNDATMGDFLQAFSLISERTNRVVSDWKVSEIKTSFDKIV